MDDKVNNKLKAAALKYDKDKDDAPILVAKGQGEIAREILKIAEKESIPILQNSPLVDALMKVEIGFEIPPELYKVVAEILAFVYSLDTTTPRIFSPSK
ncbi:EscU/YscU/HrcU family type III secretion system export apparatus switch protein [Thermovenabulum gondwanense]|uniref:Flagellar biosynthetic protein FlhB n=1 Tax=Thermovenabulum gondwanense TaxID=520767 RepID=A0A161PTH7_9FIRM|nr:EscU/YscU/HrcU family type III secretion system export apparatus switch protein [Thermovenabulum gondwanense]KYO64921.1 Flagellar biosynthetic protein FlhB [Thermovenabulum gondwanense]